MFVQTPPSSARDHGAELIVSCPVRVKGSERRNRSGAFTAAPWGKRGKAEREFRGSWHHLTRRAVDRGCLPMSRGPTLRTRLVFEVDRKPPVMVRVTRRVSAAAKEHCEGNLCSVHERTVGQACETQAMRLALALRAASAAPLTPRPLRSSGFAAGVVAHVDHA